MPQGPHSRIVIRRPDGRIEIIGRNGYVDPHDTARLFSAQGAGDVMVIRHEHVPESGGKAETRAIHTVQS